MNLMSDKGSRVAWA